VADLKMPSLGADMEFGTLVQWRVAAGDRVRRGDIVAEVETQKGVFEIDIREDAVIGELMVAEGARVKVGAPLASLMTTAGAAERPTPTIPRPTIAPEVVSAVPASVPAPPPSPERVRASPLARKVASELGIDLAGVAGTGEGGVITKDDVERSTARGAGVMPEAQRPVMPPAPVTIPEGLAPPAPVAGMRQAIAAAVSRSKREIPHYYLTRDIELGTAMSWLRSANESRPVKDRMLPAALLLKGVALALTKFPQLNGFHLPGEFRPSADIHLGVAIAIRDSGLIAPAILHADRLSLADFMRSLTDLVRRARSGGLKASEMTDPTVTVTNLGDDGVQTVLAVITPPQVAIVGFGAITERPWAEHGMIGVRPVVTASLAADHRASDGRIGAQFLAELARLLGTPEAL
jgi:pyruvate dehydrogenase E2 component (dihydrolipoamide acetyltransferase)